MNDVLKEALDEMRSEMRARVGKKLLSVEVHAHDEEPDGDAQPADDDEEQRKGDPAKKMGMPLL